MKLVYIGKTTTFIINGNIIQYVFAIPFKKHLIKIKLKDEKCETLDWFHLLIIDEISLVGDKMLNLINHKLHVIKQAHNQVMGWAWCHYDMWFLTISPSSKFMDLMSS